MGSLSAADPDRGPRGVDPEVQLARCYLSRVSEPANLAVWAFVADCGPVEAARLIRSGEVPAAVASATQARRASADPHQDMAAAEVHGLSLITPEDSRWPHFAFAALGHYARRRIAPTTRVDSTDRRPAGPATNGSEAPGAESIPPLALWAKGPGDLTTSALRAVAMVGSRACTPYGEQVTTELSYGLARADVTVVSGGAFGIDTAAHRGALAADGATVLVSAAGLDRPYPAGNAALFERVAHSGLLLSESPPGAAPQRQRFLSRNRLIAALATATVVVEAARRSGALNTAKHCRNLGRPTLAVPGPVTSALSVGAHELLRREQDPALLVTSVDQILDVVGEIGEGIGPDPRRGDQSGRSAPVGSAARLQHELDRLDVTARRVFDGFPGRAAVSEDELARRSGVAPLQVIRSLPALRIAGLISPTPAGWVINPELRPGQEHGQR